MKKLNILFFASLKESFGQPQIWLEVPDTITTTGDLRDFLISRGNTALADCKNLRSAVNQEMGDWQTAIENGDEIAFFPPVTGG